MLFFCQKSDDKWISSEEMGGVKMMKWHEKCFVANRLNVPNRPLYNENIDSSARSVFRMNYTHLPKWLAAHRFNVPRSLEH